MDEKDNIELRSEKVRNIIGGVPPRLVRAGTVVIINNMRGSRPCRMADKD